MSQEDFKFNEENMKEPAGNGDYFQYGVHKVNVLGFEYELSKAKKTPGIKVVVVDPENDSCEDSATVYFTDKSAIYSTNTLRQIALMNTSEKNHDAVKKDILGCEGPIALAKLLTEKMAGKKWQCYFMKSLSLTQTYEKDGEIRKSTDRAVFGYEPKMKPGMMPEPKTGKPMSEEMARETFGAPVDEPPFKGSGTQESDWK